MIVLDDFLECGEFETLSRIVIARNYKRIGVSDKWTSLYTVRGGAAFVGADYWKYNIEDVEAGHISALEQPAGDITLPINALVSKVVPLLGSWQPFRERSAYTVTARSQAYGVGGSIPPHDDSHYAAAYTFYVSTSWNAENGGELVVYDGELGDAHADFSLSDWGDAAISARAEQLGVAAYVCPRPNRLVVMRSNRLHQVLRVDDNAGGDVRYTISGFVKACGHGP